MTSQPASPSTYTLAAWWPLALLLVVATAASTPLGRLVLVG